MKIFQFLILISISLFLASCAPLNPVSSIKNDSIFKFKYAYIPNTQSLSSSAGTTIDGQYYTTSKTVNPKDVIAGRLVKKGFIIVPRIDESQKDQTLVVNYGESGTRKTGFGSYAIEVTIQIITSNTNQLISTCTAEGRGQTEADDIRMAINSCLDNLLNDN